MGLSFQPAFLLLQASDDVSQLPAALQNFSGYDTYGAVVLGCNTTIRSPLTGDLIDLARNLVVSQLQAVSSASWHNFALEFDKHVSISLPRLAKCTDGFVYPPEWAPS